MFGFCEVTGKKGVFHVGIGRNRYRKTYDFTGWTYIRPLSADFFHGTIHTYHRPGDKNHIQVPDTNSTIISRFLLSKVLPQSI